MWRIAALNEAGGWKDRTTVEDMDLAVRATLKGWKFVYAGDVQVQYITLHVLMAITLLERSRMQGYYCINMRNL